MFGHSLDAPLLFAPNCHQFGYVQPSPLKDSFIFLFLIVREFTSTLLPPPPPPPLLSSCLAPLAHSYRPRRCFCCSLMIVVCSRRFLCRPAAATAVGSVFSTATDAPLPRVVATIFVVVTVAVVVVLIVIAILVAAVDNDAVPGLRRILRRRSSSSLLSRCFLRRHCRCLRLDVVAVSAAAATYQPPWS